MKSLAYALLSCTLAATAKPLLTIYRTDVSPTLDGSLDDACWRAAAATAAFVNAKGEGFPDEQTRVQMCYDATHLYLGIEAFEGMLAPALNMLHRVRADKTGEDAAVFVEDCVEIFLQPQPGGPYYHFAANSGTGTFDGIAMGSDWDSGWTCRTRRGTESYVIEAAIPFAALKARPSDAPWRMNLTRSRPQAEELSTWSGLQGGFHQPSQFGTLRFAETGPAIIRASLEPEADSVTLQATTVAADPHTHLVLAVQAGDSIESVQAEGPGTHTLTVRVPADARTAGVATVSCRLTQGGTVVAASALVAVRFAAGTAVLRLGQNDVVSRVYLNGDAQAASGTSHALGLQPGINAIAFETARTGANPSLNAQLLWGDRPVPVVWQMTDTDPRDWRQAIPAGEDWTPADAVAKGTRWPENRDGMRLAAAVYVGSSRPQLFPKTSVFAVPRDSSQLLRAYLHTPKELPSEGYAMVIEMPAALQFEAFEPMTSDGQAEVRNAGTLTVDGVALTRYVIGYDSFPGRGMELSMRWGDKDGHTIAYEPVLRTGGTHDWKKITATITPPERAVSAHPLIIKWQNCGITGSFWVDNVVLREKGRDDNLLTMGTFDEPEWERSFPAEGPDGSKCFKVVATTEDTGRQQACWVDEGARVVPVSANTEYVVEVEVKCENLGSPSSRPVIGMLFRAPADMAEAELPMFTYAQSLSGAVVELPRRGTVKILPPLKDVRPKHARIAPCYYSSRFTDPAVARAYAENCWKSGITWTYGRVDNDVVPHLLPRGHQVFLSIPWHAWAAPAKTRPLLEEHEGWQAMDFKGKRLNHTVCPTLMLSEQGAPFLQAVETFLLDILNSQPYAGANWDLEQPVIDPPTFCVCPRCLDEFRRAATLPEDAPLDADTILETYPAQWTDFRCRQNADLAGHLKAVVHRADRPVEFSMYSGYQSKRTKEHYGVDWERLAPHLDFAIAGYNGGRKQVEDTRQALDGVPFMGGEMWYLSDTNDARPTPRMETWRNRILMQYVNSGCNGCLIWWLPPMDGGAFFATSEAAAIIAEHEPMLRQQQRCDEQVRVDGLGQANWAAFAHEGRTLVMLFNLEDNAVPCVVETPRGRKTVDVEAFGTGVVTFE